MSTEQILLIDNSNVIELRGLRNALDDEFLNTALVAATIETLRGDIVVDTVVLNATDEPGCYRSLLAPDLPVIEDQRYKLTLHAQGAGLTAHWQTYVQAKTRRI